jgi:hypothetical protein
MMKSRLQISFKDFRDACARLSAGNRFTSGRKFPPMF